jgi:hypothetical protein
MDNTNSNGAFGLLYVIIGIGSGIIGWLNEHTIHENLQNLSLIISCFAGLMAIRHYYLQNKKKK